MAQGYSVEQRESGLSVAAFFDWIGVSQNAFYVWRRKLRMANESRCDESRPSVTAAFVPLTVIAAPVVEIELPCGANVRVPNDENSLRRVLRILIESGSETGHDAGGDRR